MLWKKNNLSLHLVTFLHFSYHRLGVVSSSEYMLGGEFTDVHDISYSYVIDQICSVF